MDCSQKFEFVWLSLFVNHCKDKIKIAEEFRCFHSYNELKDESVQLFLPVDTARDMKSISQA